MCEERYPNDEEAPELPDEYDEGDDEEPLWDYDPFAREEHADDQRDYWSHPDPDNA